MRFCALAKVVVVAIADRFAKTLEPYPGKCEFDAENGKTNRYKDQRWPGSDNHDHTEQQHGRAHDAYDDASRRFIREMNDLLDQAVRPSFLLRLAVALGR